MCKLKFMGHNIWIIKLSVPRLNHLKNTCHQTILRFKNLKRHKNNKLLILLKLKQTKKKISAVLIIKKIRKIKIKKYL